MESYNWSLYDAAKLLGYYFVIYYDSDTGNIRVIMRKGRVIREIRRTESILNAISILCEDLQDHGTNI